MKERINKGEIDYFEMHLSHCGQQINYAFLGDIDTCFVECIAITEEGNPILNTGVGKTPLMVKNANQVIVESNTHQPAGLEGVHDIDRYKKHMMLRPLDITNHPKFRKQLMDYVERAEKEVGGHESHILEEALSWQINGMKYGTMDVYKIKKIKEESKNE